MAVASLRDPPTDPPPSPAARIARAARAGILASGARVDKPATQAPQGVGYKSHKIDGNLVVVKLDLHGERGTVDSTGAGGIRGFAIAGFDHVFHHASKVDLHDDRERGWGWSVVVSSEAVREPGSVRYGFVDDATLGSVVLGNRTGGGWALPLVPFRTDDWFVGGFEAQVT